MDELNKVSDNFWWSEVTSSDYAERNGLVNIPPYEMRATIKHTAQQMEKVRAILGKPVTVTSWYRSVQVNRGIGSKSDNSQHTKGEAVDFVSRKFGSPLDICVALIKSGLQFDQLILEHSWVHISFVSPPRQPRNQVLSLLRNGKYARGLTDKEGNLLWPLPRK